VRSLVAATALILGGLACLPAEKPVAGRLLVAGRTIERASFEEVEGRPVLVYETRKANARPGLGGVTDVHVVPWEGGEARLVVADRSDTSGWSHRDDATGIRYFMLDERRNPSGAGSLATLVRVSLTEGVLERIPDVSSFSAMGAARFFYQRPIAGSPLRELHLRVPTGEDLVVGRPTGQVQFARDDRIYMIAGDDRTWQIWKGPGQPSEKLRAGVSRFLLRGDEGLAILVVSEMGRPQTVLFDMVTRKERKLPVQNPCCWLRFEGTTFVFGESANPTAGAPARLHFFDTKSDEDRVLAMPEGLADVTAFGASRPGHPNELFYFDSKRRIAVQRPGADPPIRLLPLQPLSQKFTSDGKWLVYIEPDADKPPAGELPAGVLMAIDGDFSQPPRQLSPPGLLVTQNGFFFIGGPDPLVFWGHYGRGASDLFYANHETGAVKRAAQGISEVSVTSRHVFGIMRVSLQDLTGELVRKDVMTGEEQLIESSVMDFTVEEGRLAITVRERAASGRDGLWAIEGR
jgi:hypothetical protein